MKNKSTKKIAPRKNPSQGKYPPGKDHKKNITNTHPTEKLFPIVVIGASAGGLEAYSKLIKNLSANTGMAYVVIQHLSPDYKSMLSDILQRESKLEVVTIKNSMQPQPNKIFVAPPTYSVSIKEGKFHLDPRGKNKKPFKPIDIFMRSLSEDNSHFAIGVIMSGTDNDGVIGMEKIKASGGITYAQDSQSAKFNEMPKNSVNAGVVDFVLNPEAIARELIRVSKNVHLGVNVNLSETKDSSDSDIEITKILNMLRVHKNIDFRLYKPTTIRRRILRRMVMHKVNDLSEYVKMINGNFEEMDALCDDILINVTSFFRDPQMYESLKKNVFPNIIKNKKDGDPIRIWITACSTGEEAYSMAMILSEFLKDKINNFKIQIFSTDLNDKGIEKARSGIYPVEIKNDISEKRLKKFFVRYDGKFRISKSIRDLCVFARQNLLQDPPFGKVDTISCRNVLIYLGSVLHNKILPLFHYSLNPNGFLVLGTAETVGIHKNLFEIIDRTNRIYRKIRSFPVSEPDYNWNDLFYKKMNISDRDRIPGRVKLTESFKKEAESLILKKYAPTGVIINNSLEVMLFWGNIERYIEINETKNILKMCNQELCKELKYLINESVKKNKPMRKNNFAFKRDDQKQLINIIIEPLKDSSIDKKLYLILFEENVKINYRGTEMTGENISSKPEGISQDVDKMKLSKEYLRTIIEKHETSNEELRSANEEIQITNEELQSTNEELETTKEELQSTNEELTTVNEELQNRYSELNSVNNDLNNLLGSIKISILIVDNNLNIKRFTNESSKLLNLIPGDIGRKITDINPNLDLKDLESLIHEVIETSQIKETEVPDHKHVSWYSMRIRPYKTMENKIDGVIITFIEITEMKEIIKQQEIHREEVEELNKVLEDRVKERTEELDTSNKDLKLEVLERKNMENSLRILSQSLIGAQETERIKLSRELHDNVNQILSIAKLKAYTAEQRLKDVVKNKFNLKFISDTKKYIEKAIEEIRRLSHALRPSALADLGITAAIQSITSEFRERTNITVNFTENRLRKRFSEETELTLYRVVQEGLQNIEKHSNATSVKIDIKQIGNNIQLTVSDNGTGFAHSKNVPKKNVLHQRLGLMGIKERAESVGGKLIVKTEQGLGTLIEVIIPIKLNKNGRSSKKNKDLAGRRSSVSKDRVKDRTPKK